MLILTFSTIQLLISVILARVPGNTLECLESETTIRKEVRTMKEEGDFDDFVSAFLELAEDGTLTNFTELHGPQFFWLHSHNTPRFLPWHRVFLKRFEELLQQRGAAYIPYWDWTRDYRRPQNSPILSREYFGEPDPETGHIINSRFRDFQASVGEVPLIRDYDPEESMERFWNKEQMDELVEMTQFSQFSYEMELHPHALVHAEIGGPDGQLTDWRSPTDPLFWVHHSFIDYQWARFQEREGNRNFDGEAYQEFNDTFADMTIDELLLPYEIPIGNVLMLRDTCVSYDRFERESSSSPPPTRVSRQQPTTTATRRPSTKTLTFLGQPHATGFPLPESDRIIYPTISDFDTSEGVAHHRSSSLAIANLNPLKSTRQFIFIILIVLLL